MLVIFFIKPVGTNLVRGKIYKLERVGENYRRYMLDKQNNGLFRWGDALPIEAKWVHEAIAKGAIKVIGKSYEKAIDKWMMGKE